MFKGESFVKFKSAKPVGEVFSMVEDTLQPLGKVQINNRGAISISPKDKYHSFVTDTTVEGELKKGKTSDEYTLTLNYDCSPSVANWIIAVVTCGFGIPVLFVPLMAKATISKDAQKLLHDVEECFGSAQPLPG